MRRLHLTSLVLLVVVGGHSALWAQGSTEALGVRGTLFWRQAAFRDRALTPGVTPNVPPPITTPSSLTFTFGAVDFPTAPDSRATDINDKGKVVGSYGASLATKNIGDIAFRLSGTTFKKIAFPGAVHTEAFGINKAGVISGTYDGNGIHAFRLSGNTYTSIDYPGALNTLGYKINNSGQIVGDWEDANTLHGYLLSGGVFTSLDPPGSLYTEALGINTAGDVVGSYIGADLHTHGWLLHNGTYTTIDFPGSTDTWLLDINDKGQIVGGYGTGLVQIGPFLWEVYHGFLYDNGTFTGFDVPHAGAAVTLPYGLNNKSEIVGPYIDQNGTYFGYIASFQ